MHLHAFAVYWPIPSNTHGIIGDEHPAMPAILLFTGGFCAIGLVTVENMVCRQVWPWTADPLARRRGQHRGMVMHGDAWCMVSTATKSGIGFIYSLQYIQVMVPPVVYIHFDGTHAFAHLRTTITPSTVVVTFSVVLATELEHSG